MWQNFVEFLFYEQWETRGTDVGLRVRNVLEYFLKI